MCQPRSPAPRRRKENVLVSGQRLNPREGTHKFSTTGATVAIDALSAKALTHEESVQA